MTCLEQYLLPFVPQMNSLQIVKRFFVSVVRTVATALDAPGLDLLMKNPRAVKIGKCMYLGVAHQTNGRRQEDLEL